MPESCKRNIPARRTCWQMPQGPCGTWNVLPGPLAPGKHPLSGLNIPTDFLPDFPSNRQIHAFSAVLSSEQICLNIRRLGGCADLAQQVRAPPLPPLQITLLGPCEFRFEASVPSPGWVPSHVIDHSGRVHCRTLHRRRTHTQGPSVTRVLGARGATTALLLFGTRCVACRTPRRVRAPWTIGLARPGPTSPQPAESTAGRGRRGNVI